MNEKPLLTNSQVIESIHALTNAVESLHRQLSKLQKEVDNESSKWSLSIKANHRYQCGDKYVDLTEVESVILDCLVTYSSNVVTTGHLCELLGLNPTTQKKNLKVYVYRLKVKLRQMGSDYRRITAVRGLGYRLDDKIMMVA